MLGLTCDACVKRAVTKRQQFISRVTALDSARVMKKHRIEYVLTGVGYALGMTLSSAGELLAGLVVLAATVPAAIALFWAHDRRNAS